MTKILLQGWGLLVGAAISSPFAGAMAPAATDLHGFYVGLALLMCGAPVLVSSSLVAIMVFKGTIPYEDMPSWLRWIPGANSRGYAQEAVLYTALVLPMLLLLGGTLYILLETGIIVHVAEMLGVTMQSVSQTHGFPCGTITVLACGTTKLVWASKEALFAAKIFYLKKAHSNWNELFLKYIFRNRFHTIMYWSTTFLEFPRSFRSF